MTDLEIRQLCAEARGWDRTIDYFEWEGEADYDPLTNDAHAMALVKKFNLCLDFDCVVSLWQVYDHIDEHMPCHTSSADLNRAISECVANLQRKKK